MKKVKKILKYFLITIVLIVIAFFTAGICCPAVSYESKVTVSKPVETSFGVFTNAMKLSDWITGLKGIGWINGNQNEVGSKWKFIVTRFGSDYELIQTLTAFRQNELFTSNSDNEAFTNKVEIKFISKGASTEIIASSKLEGKNILWKSAFASGQFFLHKQDQEMYDKLKEIIEKEP